MARTLEELVQDRKDLIEAHRKNNFTDGIHALLTDLYPDTAHFIYELLQNAEDMDATVVRFILDQDGIDFEHNGTKRSFNISDIDAITNIGNNGQKKDDPTSIGKFGVGFKAVFAYTSTPVIHSGEYHFEIHDYFVPVFDGVEAVKTVDPYGVSWTKFSFPFNNPKKPKDVAYKECLEGLSELDATSILFLQNIRRIEYMLPSSEIGTVERTDDENNHVLISHKKAGEKKTDSRWLKFFKHVDITDDQGREKHLPIAISFFLKNDNQSKKYIITPVTGKTFIYFPAEKEQSGLKFHINAPFASTVARDSVRECKENIKLIKEIAKMVADILPIIKEQGMVNQSFFETLPNYRDDLSVFYSYIMDYLYVAFQENEYLPAKNGGFVTAKNALIGPAVISNLFFEKDLIAFTNTPKKWVANASMRYSRADYFLQSIDIQTFSYSDFANVFSYSYRFNTEKQLENKSIEWLKRFYILCSETYEELEAGKRKNYLQDLMQTKVIKSSDGDFRRTEEVFILPSGVKLLTSGTPIVENELIVRKANGGNTPEKIKVFFREKLGISDYGPKIEIEHLLVKYSSRYKIDEKYFQDMMLFAEYNQSHDDIDFSTYPLFLYMDVMTGAVLPAKANELFFGKEYDNEGGEFLAEAYQKHCLWNRYIKVYAKGSEVYKRFMAFATLCGVSKELSIVRQAVSLNPQYKSQLSQFGDRQTEYAIDSDYTIPEIEHLLSQGKIEVSRLIWNAIDHYGKIDGTKYTIARYAPNASRTCRTCDSTLVYYLKQYEWIPDKNGRLLRPANISITELNKELLFDSSNAILDALHIGSKERDKKRQFEIAKRVVEDHGLHCINDNDYKFLCEIKAKRELKKDTTLLSSKELLNKQKKQSKDTLQTCEFQNDSIKREINIEFTFKNAKKMKSIPREIFARVMECTVEERHKLMDWYHGECQMCGMKIIKYDKQPYFIAKNIISMRYLPENMRKTNILAWNSLCLCPNCAARYDVCSRDLNGLYEQILAPRVLMENERVVLTIELDDKKQKIIYKKEHFLILQKAFHIIDKEISKK